MRPKPSWIALLAVAVAVASCGGPPAASRVAPASDAPGIAGLDRAIQDAHAAVAASQRDAARAAATTAGQ